MKQVRIVVARPELSAAADPVAVLERLGPEAAIELVHSAAECCAQCSDGSVDLVVADDDLGKECAEILELLRRVHARHAASFTGHIDNRTRGRWH